MSNVDLFRKWKHGNSKPEEKLNEALVYKAEHPEDMKTVLIIWTDENELIQYECDSDLKLRDLTHMLETVKLKAMGVLE